MTDTSAEEPRTPKITSAPVFEQVLRTPPNLTHHKQDISPSNNDNSINETFYGLSTPSQKNEGYNSLSNVPQTPHSHPNNNTFTSPLRSPSASYDNHFDDSFDQTPPIRHISNTLKTRLSYAFVKYQKGWSNQSLDELEKSIDENGDELLLSNKLQVSPQSKKSSPSKIVKPNQYPVYKSPGLSSSIKLSNQQLLQKLKPKNTLDGSHSGDSTDEENDSSIVNNIDSETEGSANKAFIQAISKQSSPVKKLNLYTQSSRNPALKLERTSLNAAYNPEADAIESLMSLSSPKYSQPSYGGSQSSNSSPKRNDVGSSAALSNLVSPGNGKIADKLINKKTKNAITSEFSSKAQNGNGEETEDDITDDERSDV